MPRKAKVFLNEDTQEKIVRALRIGAYVPTAAALAGIDSQTLLAWLRRGAREKERRRQYAEDVRLRRNRERDRGRRLSDSEKAARRVKVEDHKAHKKREQPYVDFHTKVDEAMANAEMGDLSTISMAAKGGAIVERKTITDPKTGAKTIIEKHAPPQWQAAAWKLERRNPSRWAKIQRMEVTSGDGKQDAATLVDVIKQSYEASKRKKDASTRKMEDFESVQADFDDARALPQSVSDGRVLVPDEIEQVYKDKQEN